jgi:hypothetical protein
VKGRRGRGEGGIEERATEGREYRSIGEEVVIDERRVHRFVR